MTDSQKLAIAVEALKKGHDCYYNPKSELSCEDLGDVIEEALSKISSPETTGARKPRELWIKKSGYEWDGYDKYSVSENEPKTVYGNMTFDQDYKKYREVTEDEE